MADLILRLDERRLDEVIDKILGRFAFLIQRELIMRFPTSFKNRIKVAKEGANWVVGSNYDILKYYDLGTKAHEIRAKLKQSLAFGWGKSVDIPGQPKDGKYLLKKVNHPGTKGKHIIENLEKDKRLLQQLLDRAVRDVAR